MPVNYQDFFPAVLKSGIFQMEYEAIPAVIVRVNEWVLAAGVNIVNIETVVLPNVQNPETASKSGLIVGEISAWYQVVRVWYEGEPRAV